MTNNHPEKKTRVLMSSESGKLATKQSKIYLVSCLLDRRFFLECSLIRSYWVKWLRHQIPFYPNAVLPAGRNTITTHQKSRAVITPALSGESTWTSQMLNYPCRLWSRKICNLEVAVIAEESFFLSRRLIWLQMSTDVTAHSAWRNQSSWSQSTGISFL